MLTIGSALSKGWRSGPEAFRAGHYKDLTETGNTVAQEDIHLLSAYSTSLPDFILLFL